jgi:hypothetical protein
LTLNVVLGKASVTMPVAPCTLSCLVSIYAEKYAHSKTFKHSNKCRPCSSTPIPCG